jgi:hypothetical protein
MQETDWRSWNTASRCPRCKGWRGWSGEADPVCNGGLMLDRPSTIYCSHDRTGRPTASGKTYAFKCAPAYAWSETAGERAHRNDTAPYWGTFPPGIPRDWRQVAAYDYNRTTPGAVFCEDTLFSVLRFAPSDPEERARRIAAGERVKDFRPIQTRAPLQPGKHGWLWSLAGVQRIPYRLPELRAAVADGRRVFAVEGEKDADAGFKHEPDAVYTTAPGGVRGWDAFLRDHAGAAHFAGVACLDVVLHRDANGAGHALREILERHLSGTVPAFRFWQAHQSIETNGADLADHFDHGFKLADLAPA